VSASWRTACCVRTASTSVEEELIQQLEPKAQEALEQQPG
jgi:hypothetical protein